MPWKFSGRIIRVGKAWVDNDGTQYPAVWNNYSADEKAAIGLNLGRCQLLQHDTQVLLRGVMLMEQFNPSLTLQIH